MQFGDPRDDGKAQPMALSGPRVEPAEAGQGLFTLLRGNARATVADVQGGPAPSLPSA